MNDPEFLGYWDRRNENATRWTPGRQAKPYQIMVIKRPLLIWKIRLNREWYELYDLT